MSNPNQSFSFTQGGQTQIHKLRMLKQVVVTTFHISMALGLVTFIGYYLYTNHYMNIMMYLFWGLAEFMNVLKEVFKHMKGFTFYVDPSNGAIIKCTHSFFLNSPWVFNFIQYLNAQLIQGAIYAGYTVLSTFVVSALYFIHKGKKLKQNKQVSGLELTDLEGYKKSLEKNKIKSSLIVDKLPIPYDAEVKHFMISGTTGSGKSNMMNHLLKAIEERGDKAVVVDTTGGFVEKFYKTDRDIILNPFDDRSTDWCLWREPLMHSYEFEDMAASLMPQNSYGDPFWVNASRQMLSEVLRHAKKNDLMLSEALEILMTKDPHLSQKFFKGTSVGALFSKEMEKTMLSVRATLSTHLRSLFVLKDNMDGFSIDSWVKNEQQRGFLFLHGVPKQRAELSALWSVWFNIAIKAIMDLQPNPNRRIWFIVDELASLHKLPSLDMALAEGRKYGACIVLGFQNMAQIQEIYGSQGIKSMRELMVSKFAFQAVDPENAKALSQIFGQKQYVESHENISYGANEIRDGISLSHHKKKEALVDYEKLMNLEALHFYAKIDHINHCLNTSFTYYGAPSQNPSFVDTQNQTQTIGEIILQKGTGVLNEQKDEHDNIVAIKEEEVKKIQEKKEDATFSFGNLKNQIER